jgi:hypothetical protein
MRNLYLLLKDIQDKLLININSVNFIRDIYYRIIKNPKSFAFHKKYTILILTHRTVRKNKKREG